MISPSWVCQPLLHEEKQKQPRVPGLRSRARIQVGADYCPTHALHSMRITWLTELGLRRIAFWCPQRHLTLKTDMKLALGILSVSSFGYVGVRSGKGDRRLVLETGSSMRQCWKLLVWGLTLLVSVRAEAQNWVCLLWSRHSHYLGRMREMELSEMHLNLCVCVCECVHIVN